MKYKVNYTTREPVKSYQATKEWSEKPNRKQVEDFLSTFTELSNIRIFSANYYDNEKKREVPLSLS